MNAGRELTAEQQERYSRHLLLDGFDQERALAAAVTVRGRGTAAHWAARALAAAGVGQVCVEEEAWLDELRALGPWTSASLEASPGAIVCAPTIDTAADGARAAMSALREVLRT